MKSDEMTRTASWGQVSTYTYLCVHGDNVPHVCIYYVCVSVFYGMMYIRIYVYTYIRMQITRALNLGQATAIFQTDRLSTHMCNMFVFKYTRMQI
jgi:hypothetical protein